MRTLLATIALSLVCCATATAGKGVPAAGVDGATGVTAPGGDLRYRTTPAGRGTVVERITLRDGRVTRSDPINGRFSIPLVAYDGATSGLSGDGRTLALIRPRKRFPEFRTRLVLVDTATLRAVRRINLRGDFGVDAISPDGSTLYLVNYLAPDETRYSVRAYDVERGALLRDPVVDPRNPDEKMVGLPVTRAASADGRWAYTLYDDTGGSHPFVHALDTARRQAFCVDLDSLEGRGDLMALRLRLSGRTLAVTHAGEPVSLVDTKTFAVRAPSAAVPAATPSSATPSRSVDTGNPTWTWLAGLAGLLALATAGVAVAVRRLVS
jgi:hypothetical protein